MTDASAGSEETRQESVLAGARSPDAVPTAVGTTAVKLTETLEQKYMRQTRTAVVFIAVVVGVVCALSVVAAIVMGVQLAKVNTQLGNLNGSTISNSNCASQGGTNPNC